MSSSASHWTRRRALALPFAATFLATSAAPTRAARVITDALGRTVELPGPARRIVVAFYLEEFTAIAGAAGWEQAVGLRKHQWAVNRAKTYRRFAAAIPRLDALPDVGAGEEKLLIVPPWALGANRAEFPPLDASGIPFIVVDYNAQTLDKRVASIGSLTDWISLQFIAKQLYPSEFADVDPVASLRDFHARFLPVAFEGTWMARLAE
jgi:ABC-type Fe3+-hydroxamate transport system substrate-binding protein